MKEGVWLAQFFGLREDMDEDDQKRKVTMWMIAEICNWALWEGCEVIVQSVAQCSFRRVLCLQTEV